MKIAIVGATGEVGRMILTCLEELKLKTEKLALFSSAKSAGSRLYYQDHAIEVQELHANAFDEGFDYLFFSAGSAISRAYMEVAVKNAKLVIDNSSAFRMDAAVPLVIPQINGDLLDGYRGLVANPNCSTIQMLLPLAILDKAFGLKKVVVSTYQAVSGSGHLGIQSLMAQRKGLQDKGIYPELIDLNVIPQIGIFLDSGYSQEEEKMLQETRKILRNERIAVSATTVRVPVLYGHGASVYAEFERFINLRDAEELLKDAPALAYHENSYITPLGLGNSNLAHVCRLRFGVDRYSLCFWNLGHNLRIGAAANAVNIMLQSLDNMVFF